jgi:hypothetical protein
LELWREAERAATGLFVVRTFPASEPDKYLSIRGWNEAGDEIEVRMLRELNAWSGESQDALRQALQRRYLLREIQQIYQLELRAGYLDFDVQTHLGRERFAMRWTQSQAIDFGEEGKLLIDTEDNRYLVRSLAQLPKAQAEKFMQYVYW